MKRLFSVISFAVIFFLLSGCSVNDKHAELNFTLVYFSMAALSVLVALLYIFLVKKHNIYFLILFVSVAVANSGYYLLSVSPTITAALHANRLAYFGSAFLPFAMLMIILKVSNINFKKYLPFLLLAITVSVFLIAATPGYSNIYYESASIEAVNGVTVLNKVYGDLHSVYLFYLLFYFLAIIATITYSIVKRKIEYKMHAIFLAVAVSINIAVWLLGQFVKFNFEFLSISYVISAMFILGLTLMIQENEYLRKKAVSDVPPASISPTAAVHGTSAEKTAVSEPAFSIPAHDAEIFTNGIDLLTKTEKLIFDFYIEGKSTKEIMAELNIKENTLKYHNKNIYGKLGVSSRKQLIETARLCNIPKTR